MRRIAGLYGSGFELSGLPPDATAALLGVGIVLGWMGSFIAATRHLRQIEPS